MSRYAVDASVAAKWFLKEEHTDAANFLLARASELWSPDLLFAEVGNILWKRFRKGELLVEEGFGIVAALERMPLRIVPAEKLAKVAWQIASSLDRSFYDSLYLALAKTESCPLITGDRKLYNALASQSEIELIWIGDLD